MNFDYLLHQTHKIQNFEIQKLGEMNRMRELGKDSDDRAGVWF